MDKEAIGSHGQTADRVDAFVRRQALWARLLTLFRQQRPTEEQLDHVSTVAEVAIDQVFAAHHLTPAQRDERHGDIKDYADCAALYGYVLGYWQARQEQGHLAAAVLAES
ncbi:MAG: hypothetical protein NVSMB65_21950 [Chloroflexota bacterium]